MTANHADFPIAVMARRLGVSTAGYYAWLNRKPSARSQANAALLKRVRTIHAVSRGTFGAPRIHAELKADNEAVSRKRVARLMRQAALAGVSRRRGAVTTRRDREAWPAPDLVTATSELRRGTACGPQTSPLCQRSPDMKHKAFLFSLFADYEKRIQGK